MPVPRICFIANGRLYRLDPGGGETEMFSDFVRDLKRRLQSVADRSAFRKMGSGASFMLGGLPGAPSAAVEDSFHAEFSSVGAAGDGGTVCYAIDAGDVRGLFVCDLESRYERRVYHGPNYRFGSIAPRKAEDDGEEWLVSAMQDHGISRIGLFRPDKGGGVREVTEGDSLDSYPVWRPGQGSSFVYQTAGIARRPHREEWLGLGPASIESIDLESGEMATVAGDGRFDFLCPAYGPDGSLYFLRRPYEAFRRPSLWRTLSDVVMFPFRLFRAIFAFLNVFSMMFSGKPLKTAGHAPRREGPDPKAVFLHGRWVSLERQMRDSAHEEMASAVPKDWELIRRRPGGGEETVCKGVMAYAVGGEGEIVFSNGRGLFTLREGGKPERLSSRSLIDHVAIVG